MTTIAQNQINFDGTIFNYCSTKNFVSQNDKNQKEQIKIYFSSDNGYPLIPI